MRSALIAKGLEIFRPGPAAGGGGGGGAGTSAAAVAQGGKCRAHRGPDPKLCREKWTALWNCWPGRPGSWKINAETLTVLATDTGIQSSAGTRSAEQTSSTVANLAAAAEELSVSSNEISQRNE